VIHERKKGEVTGFTLVHRVPKDYSSPRSLRAYLLDQSAIPHSLSDRLQLAKDLVKAVGYVHTFGFVHKNIRPETIIVFQSSSSSIGSVSLVGFEDFRSEDGKTYRSGDEQGEKNLYRHPTRQGSTPQEDYVMQHDIYSLGVCLLEIGLWDSLLRYEQEHDVYVASAGEILPAHALTKDGVQTVKGVLIGLARELLPSKVGNKYAEIVATCLTCLDKGNVDFGDESEFADEDGVLVGVRFIQKVSNTMLLLHRLADTVIVAHENQWDRYLSLNHQRSDTKKRKHAQQDSTKNRPRQDRLASSTFS
jgi:serine/threonine protein kinase